VDIHIYFKFLFSDIMFILQFLYDITCDEKIEKEKKENVYLLFFYPDDGSVTHSLHAKFLIT